MTGYSRDSGCYFDAQTEPEHLIGRYEHRECAFYQDIEEYDRCGPPRPDLCC